MASADIDRGPGASAAVAAPVDGRIASGGIATPAPLVVRVDVDTQNGFCDPDGGLYVRGAEAVIERVAELNRDAEARGLALLGSVDTHDYASPELARNGGPWPDHCIKGTWDWLKPAATLPRRARFVGRDPTDMVLAFDGGRAALYFEKDRYSLFDNPNAEAALAALQERARAAGRPLVFEVYGVASDYCVRAAALGLRERGERVRVLADATRGVTAEGHEQALRDLAAAGVELTTMREALAPAGERVLAGGRVP